MEWKLCVPCLLGLEAPIADELRRRAREELGLTVSVGVSFNKVFAKLGSDLKKPDCAERSGFFLVLNLRKRMLKNACFYG